MTQLPAAYTKVGSTVKRVPRWRLNASGVLVEQKPKIRHGWGCSPGGEIQDDPTNDIDTQLNIMQNMGCKWCRLDVNWSQTQRNGYQTWTWTSDYVIQGAISRGMKVLANFIGNPGWNRPSYAQGVENFHITGASLTRFKEFVTGVVNHYKPMGVRHWEIRNESNLGWNWAIGTGTVSDPVRPGGTTAPVEYATLLKQTYDVIKALDPQAYILPAGTSPAGTYTVPGGSTPTGDTSPHYWYSILYYLGCKNYMDALNHHPYSATELPASGTSWWNSWYQMTTGGDESDSGAAGESLRELMVRVEDADKQIWCTEYGTPTGGNSGYTTEAGQATNLNDAMTHWDDYPWAGPFFVYSHRDLVAASDTTDIYGHYGVVRNTGVVKPAFNTFATIAGGTPAATLPPAGMALKWDIAVNAVANTSPTAASEWDAILNETALAPANNPTYYTGYVEITAPPTETAGQRNELMSNTDAHGGMLVGDTCYYEWEVYIPAAMTIPNDSDGYSTINQFKGRNDIAESHYTGGVGIRTDEKFEIRCRGGNYVGPGNNYQSMEDHTFGNLQRNTWHKIGYHVKWAKDSTGFANIYLDGVLGWNKPNIPTMSQYSNGVNFRVGWYPERVGPGNAVMRVRNVRFYT
jgi:polysaccharide lyase-like protein